MIFCIKNFNFNFFFISEVYSDVNAVAGQLTRLPCFVRPLNPSDSISLVLWYRGEDISGSPIYTLDARHQNSIEQAKHFVHKDYQHKKLMNFTLNTDHSQSSNDGSSIFSSSTVVSEKNNPNVALNNDYNASSTSTVIDHHSNNNDSATTPTSSTTTTTTTIKPIAKSTAHLYVMPVEETDAGLYWCRVDYKWERTTISTVTLNVIGKFCYLI